MTAEQARNEVTRRNQWNEEHKIELQFKRLEKKVHDAVESLSSYCTIEEILYPENIKILKEKGYKIKVTDGKTYITWV